MRATNDTKGFVSLLKGTVKGFAFAILIFFILIAVFAIIVSKTDVSDTVIQVMTLIALGIASFFSAFINQKKTRQRGIVIGAISGAEIFLIIFINPVILLFCLPKAKLPICSILQCRSVMD